MIKAYFDPPPIPLRCYDWHATEDGYEPGDPVGHGTTEAEAIAELQELLADRQPDTSTDEGMDVSEIAKQYGGGGHRNAAGFTVSYDVARSFECLPLQGSEK